MWDVDSEKKPCSMHGLMTFPLVWLHKFNKLDHDTHGFTVVSTANRQPGPALPENFMMLALWTCMYVYEKT